MRFARPSATWPVLDEEGSVMPSQGWDPALGDLMHLDVGDLPDSVDRLARIRRLCGFGVTFLGGPAAMAIAILTLDMGSVEATALLILLSGWIGPRLMRPVDA
jgi:hypothetical protein